MRAHVLPRPLLLLLALLLSCLHTCLAAAPSFRFRATAAAAQALSAASAAASTAAATASATAFSAAAAAARASEEPWMPVPPSEEDHLFKRIIDNKPKKSTYAPDWPTPYSTETSGAAIAGNGVVAVYKSGGGPMQKPWN